MLETLREKTVLLTGAGGGIGRATAIRLHKEGVRLALCGRNPEKLEQTARLVGGGTLLLPGDLLEMEYLDQCVQKTVEAFGGIDVLINNAGIAQSSPFSEITPEEFDRVLATNLRAPFFLTQKALPYLKAAHGAVINIGSVVSHKGYPLQSAYAASKHGILGFSKSLANELYEEGVRVHVISPGGVYTDMVRVARPDLAPDGIIQPEDIAEWIAFLLKSRCNAVVDEVQLHRVNKAPFA